MNLKKISIRSSGVLAVAALILLSTYANAEWYRAETNHFIIFSEDEKDETIQFTRDLERFDNALRTIQGLPVEPDEEISDANKVTIYRSGRVSGIAKLAGAPGSGVAGFYIPRAGAAVAFTPVKQDIRDIRSIREKNRNSQTALQPEQVLKHEYVHHFMLQIFPATYPDWYIEAFAELYTTIELNDDGSFHVGNPPQYRSRDLYNLPSIPLKQLFDQNDRRTGLDFYRFYSYGWLLAHYLSFNPERQPQLFQYLKALDTGADGLAAAHEAFGDLDQLQEEVERYKKQAKRGHLPGFNIVPAGYSEPEVEIRLLTEAEAAVMRERMRSKRGVTPSQARDVADDIELEAKKYSQNLFAQLVAAEAFLDARRYDEADRAVDRALALDPESSEAYFLKGMIASGRGWVSMGTADPDKSYFSDARMHFARATEIDQDDPRPYIHYYETYRLANEAAPEPAIIGLESVFERAAFDAEYRMLLARQLLIEGKGHLAKDVLAPIAFRFHGDQEDNDFRTIIDLVDENKVGEARDKMQKLFDEAEEESREEWG